MGSSCRSISCTVSVWSVLERCDKSRSLGRICAGVGITVSNMFIGYIASPINAGAVAMVAGLVIVPLVSLVTPKLKKEDVDEIFTCYEEKVVSTKKRNL